MGIGISVLRAHRLEQDVRKGHNLDELARQCAKRPELLRLRALAHQQSLLHAAAACAAAGALRCLIRCAEDAARAGAGGGAAAAAGVRAVVDARNSRGQTPLMLAAGHPDGADCVRALLAAGADPWAADVCGGRTALFYAACADAADAAALLLDATDGAPLPRPAFPNGPGTRYADVRMLAGFAALHVAVVADARRVLRLLLRAGPRLSVATLFVSFDFIGCPRGTCPMHLAARLGRLEAAKMLLLAHAGSAGRGHDPRALLDDFDRLPCQLASINGHSELARLLQPGLPLGRALAGEEDLYAGGPPPLKLLAAAALRAHQQRTLAGACVALGLDAHQGGGPARSACCEAAADAAARHSGERVHAASAVEAAAAPGGACAPRPPKDLGFEVAGPEACACGAGAGRADAGAACGSGSDEESSGPGPAAPRSIEGCGPGACAAVASGAACAAPFEATVEDECCGVCLDARPVICLRPCGHTMCAACCSGLFGMHHASVVACPFCRGRVGAFAPGPC